MLRRHRVVAGRRDAVVVDRRRQRVAVADRAARGGAAVPGQRQRALAGVHHAIGGRKRLHLRQRKHGATDHHGGNAIGRRHRKRAVGGLGVRRRVRAGRLQTRLVHRRIRTVRHRRLHAGTVVRAGDGDGQRGWARVTVGVRHGVVQRVAQAVRRRQRLRRRTAVVEHVAPRAIAVLRERAVGVQPGNRRRISRTPAHKHPRRVRTTGVVAQHIATDAAHAVLGHPVRTVHVRRRRVVHNADVHRRVGSTAVLVRHRDADGLQVSGRRGAGLGVIVDGGIQRVAVRNGAALGISGIAGQGQRAVGGVDHHRRGAKTLHLCQRQHGAAHRDTGDAVQRHDVETAGLRQRRIVRAAAGGQVVLEYRLVTLRAADAGDGDAIVRTEDGDGQRGRIRRVDAVGDGVGEGFGEGLTRRQALDGRVAVIELINVAAVGVLDDIAVDRRFGAPGEDQRVVVVVRRVGEAQRRAGVTRMGDALQHVAGSGNGLGFASKVVFLHPVGVVVGDRRAIVVDDGDGGRIVGQRGADGVAEDDLEGFITLDQDIGHDVLRNRETDVTRRNGDRARLGAVEVVIGIRGRTRHDGVGDGNRLVRDLTEGDEEGDGMGRAVGAFDHAGAGNATGDRRAARNQDDTALAGLATADFDVHLDRHHDFRLRRLGRQDDVDGVIEQQWLGVGGNARRRIDRHEIVVECNERMPALATQAATGSGTCGGRRQQLGRITAGQDGGLDILYRGNGAGGLAFRAIRTVDIGIHHGLSVTAQIEPAAVVELDSDRAGVRGADEFVGVNGIADGQDAFLTVRVDGHDMTDDDSDDTDLLRSHDLLSGMMFVLADAAYPLPAR